MSTNAPTDTGSQGVNANTQVGGNVLTGFGPPPPRSSVPIPQMPAEAQQTVQQLAPRAQTFSGPLTPSPTHNRLGEVTPTLYSTYGKPAPGPSNISQFFNKIDKLAQQGADIASIPGNVLLNIGKDTAQFIYRTGEFTGKVLMNAADQISAQATEWDLNARKDNLTKAYKAGNINGTQYKQSMKELAQDYMNNQNQYKALDAQITQNSKDLAYNATQTAILLLTLDSSGIAKGLNKFASGEGADTAMAQGVTKLLGAERGAQFALGGEKISQAIAKVPAFGRIIEAAVGSDVLAPADSLYAQSKSAAAAIFIKKPLLYNANITQAKDVYDRMAKGDYGHALVGIGLIGVQALGGGPFGYAREQFLKGTSKLSELAFGTGSFIDELSSRIGNGDRAGIFNYLQELQKSNPERYANTAQRLKELEHMNMLATNGRVAEAVDRVTNSLVDSGMTLSELTHGEVIQNGVNWAEAARMVERDIKAGLVEGVNPADAAHYAVGRLDIAGKNKLAEMFTAVDNNLSTASTVATKAYTPSAKELASYRNVFPGVTKEQAIKDLTANAQDLLAPTDTSVTMADKVAARHAAWQEFQTKNPNVGFTNNLNIQSKIEQLITNVEDTKELETAIKSISTQKELSGLSQATKDYLAKRGFVLIRPLSKDANFVPFEETSQVLHTNFAQPGEGIFQKNVEPVPILSHIGSALEKAGLSPRDATQLTQDIYKGNLADNLNSLKLSQGFENVTNGTTAADNILNRLNSFARDRKIPVTDLRQLPIGGLGKGSPKGIAEALGISRDEAKMVAGALNDAMIRVPLQYRGAGDRLIDYNFKFNPLAGGYARIQNTFRYAWNPFFKWKLDTKTEVFAQLEANGKQISYPMINKFNDLVFPGKTGELNNIVGKLESSGILRTGYGGEGAEDIVVGNIGARLTKAQKRSVAGVVDAMATTQGKTVDQMLIDNPQQVTDALRILVQYPRTGFVNSPLVRTLNTAFFPTRFNVKVAELSAKALAKQSSYMQVAIIKGLYNFNAWLKTDEGTAWQSTHSDVISLLAYVSPLHTLAQTFANLQGHAESVGDLGELGGLPFGIIPQMLSSQGIIPNLNTPYVNPSSGVVSPQYIPQTSKARLATAIQDLLGSVFTYPGQTAGLPGKASTLRTIVNAPLGVKTADYKKVDQTANLSPSEAHESSVISNLPQNQSPLGAPAFSSESGIYHPPTPQPSGNAAPINRGTHQPTLNKLQVKALQGSSGGRKPKKIASGVPSR